MKRLVLLGLSLALCFAGWMNIRDYQWAPADAPGWNPFAIKESGVGRTLARVLTEQANTSFHHGLYEQRPPNVTNPFSQWILLDRKSTRLNSSHTVISYAVFCLKKKNK